MTDYKGKKIEDEFLLLFKQLQTILILGNVMSVAYVMINTVPDKMEAVLEKIREIQGVKDAYMVYGVYDIIAEVKAVSTEELKTTILNIRILKHVLSTLTLRVVN